MKADLTNAEIDELDALLRQAPAPLEPLDVVSLDGYLCAVAVQPRIVPPADWLARALDTDGSRWPPAALDEGWLARVRGLVQRRYEAIVRGLDEEGLFDPVVTDMDQPETGGAADSPPAASAVASGAEPTEPTALAEPHESHKPTDPADPVDAAIAALPAYSQPLVYWASGFLYGAQTFEALMEHPDDAVHIAMSRILRHLPPEAEEDHALVAELNEQVPLRDASHAIEDAVDAAVTMWKLTAQDRLTVRTIQREGAKVGRNDPCPCGSGKKYKQCHGKT